MPRTEHLANLSPNHIYALDAQVRYLHHTANSTTAVIEDDNVQSRITIPKSLNNIREEIEEGMNYHFGFCYISPNGWIKARNPDHTIKPHEQNSEAVINPMLFSDIVNNCQSLNGHYLSTLLFVVKVNQSQQVTKNGKNLSMVILNCYANGYLVDVTLWNSDLPIGQLANKWVVFSGFRLKKLVDWKFLFVSSVYSKIAPYNQEPKGIPYAPHGQYHNLSEIYDSRSISQIAKDSLGKKLYSQTQGLLKKVQMFNYEGCSTCKKKVIDGNACPCKPNNDIKVFSIQKLTIVGSDQSILEASVFDEQIQNQINSLQQPTLLKFNIKSTTKTMPTGQQIQSHNVTKVSI